MPSGSLVPAGRRLPRTPGGRVDLATLADRPDPEESFTDDDWAFVLEGIPETTRATYRQQWTYVLKTCGHPDRNWQALPMTDATCVRLLRLQRARPGRYSTPQRFRPVAPATVRLMLAVIAVVHKNARRDDGEVGWVPPTERKTVRAAFRAYRRWWLSQGFRPDTSSPIAPEEQEAMIATLDTRSVRGLRDAAVLSLYGLGPRIGEVCALNLNDVQFHLAGDEPAEGDSVMVRIAMSKTNDTGETAGEEWFPLDAHPVSAAGSCPVRLLWRWVQACAEFGFVEGPLFRRLLGGGPAPKDGRPRESKIVAERMPRSAPAALVRDAAHAAGLLDAGRHIVWHSMRSGPATRAAERDVSVVDIYDWFRWSKGSPTGMRYMRAGRRRGTGNVARRIRFHAA